MQKNPPGLLDKILAWSVHLFTASGLIAGFMAILAINAKDWRMAMVWLVLALIIDGVDGSFARIFRVKEVLPGVDGKTIDFVIDFATYAIIPAYFFYMAELVPQFWLLPCVAIILLVSALYYGITGMVSEDMYFIGFPVLWNMVVFYLIFVFQASQEVNIVLTLFFAILHFVPIKFVYPSQGSSFRWLTVGVTVIFLLNLLYILFVFPERQFISTFLAYVTAIYYGALAIYDTWVKPKILSLQ